MARVLVGGGGLEGAEGDSEVDKGNLRRSGRSGLVMDSVQQ